MRKINFKLSKKQLPLLVLAVMLVGAGIYSAVTLSSKTPKASVDTPKKVLVHNQEPAPTKTTEVVKEESPQYSRKRIRQNQRCKPDPSKHQRNSQPPLNLSMKNIVLVPR